jgi:hypothetical protein
MALARTRTKWSFSNLAACAALVVFLLPGVARADGEPSPADVESAKVAYQEGQAAREKNDHPTALAKFRAAYALVPTPITGLEVGRELIATGKILEGRALLLEVSRMPKKPGESEKAQEARDEAADLAQKAHGKLATLTVETDATDVSIDDVAIPKDATHAPRVLDPGHHVIVVRSGGKIGRAEVDLAPGDQHQVRVDADHDDGTKPPVEHGGRLVFRPRTPFFVSVVVTGAGLVLGVATGIPAVAIAGHLSSECPSKKCPPSAAGDLDATLALGWVSTIGFAVAGAGAIATIITAALSTHHEEPPPPPPQQTSVRLVPTIGGLLLEGTF